MGKAGMHRRGLLLGLGAALAMPAIVKAESLMKVAALRSEVRPIFQFDPALGDFGEVYYVANRQIWVVRPGGFFRVSSVASDVSWE